MLQVISHDDRHYVPAIEDVKVGYECEINESLGYSEIYTKRVIGYKEDTGAYTNEVSNIINMIDDGYGAIRVPFLTKEQIEAEGWKFKDQVTARTCTYIKDGFTLAYNKEDHRLRIARDSDMFQILDCTCLSINEFRYLNRILTYRQI